MRKRAVSSVNTSASSAPVTIQRLLTVDEVADILQVSKVKVYLLLKNGLPSLKIDGSRRIQPDKLQAWIEQHSA